MNNLVVPIATGLACIATYYFGFSKTKNENIPDTANPNSVALSSFKPKKHITVTVPVRSSKNKTGSTVPQTNTYDKLITELKFVLHQRRGRPNSPTE